MVYQLAENLHCPVSDLKEYPVSELKGWIDFYQEKERREQVKKGNLMAMDFDSEEGIDSLKQLGVIG